MKSAINPTKTDANVEHAWVAALSDERIAHAMETTPSQIERTNYGRDGDIMMKIAKFKMKGSIAEAADHIYAECAQAKAQNRIEELLVRMLQLGNNPASNRIKIAFD